MAKISESRGRVDENSGYTRLVGDRELGRLLSQLQAAVIRSGNELEKLLAQSTRRSVVSLEQALAHSGNSQFGLEVVFNPVLTFVSEKAIKADVFLVDHSRKTCMVIELKDGDTFDTKKASGELVSLQRFAKVIGVELGYNASYRFCSFNQPDKLAIVRGAKNRFALAEVMTGREICAFLDADFGAIVEYRIQEQQENLSYFLDQLSRMGEVRKGLHVRLCSNEGL